MATFNGDQAGMGFFLLVCTLFNIWFVLTSIRRVWKKSPTEDGDAQQTVAQSVLCMALFDIPWVWLCAIQCLYNTFTTPDNFHQSSGNDSFGCTFMGWYSSFSMVSMMGSNCLVAYALMGMKKQQNRSGQEPVTTRPSIPMLALIILLAACLFASMPLMQGDGYYLTNGGFCYVDFTNTVQSSIILALCGILLLLSTALWCQVGLREYWYFYGIFFCTWILWIPACIYGIVHGSEIAYPYMIIGAIVGHGNALVNPLLYGKHLFEKLAGDGEYKLPENLPLHDGNSSNNNIQQYTQPSINGKTVS